MLNVCLICSALLIVKVIFVITVFYLFLFCVSTILVNKDDHSEVWCGLMGVRTLRSPERPVPLPEQNL